MSTVDKRKREVRGKNVALTPELIARLDERAELEDRSVSSIVRLALRAYLEEREPAP